MAMIERLSLIKNFEQIRKYSETLCSPLQNEDYSVQPVDFVSPPKWHLAHTTWFWEEFVLKGFLPDYKIYRKDFSYLFNSYYNHAGQRVERINRGLMTRPTVQEIYAYRAYVDNQMGTLLSLSISEEAQKIIETGLNHEQQHQELLLYDIKYILGHQPLFPSYGPGYEMQTVDQQAAFHVIPEGIYEIGHQGEDFCFDNELNRHKVYLPESEIRKTGVSNGEYLEFIKAGGYENFDYWHDEGWSWIKNHAIKAPLYWHLMDDTWFEYDLDGLRPLDLLKPVKHISYYEAHAFAEWQQMRLPTEFEWEIASPHLNKGHTWEWTGSAYLPYPGFAKAPGALGEYNGKFMVNQMVLRGASVVTPAHHSRSTYRNFFHPNMRWQYSGIRLAKSIKSH